ncbi:MAG: SH3 domain-containing protein [Gallicola sp.]|nr:SH3 domain-containing protein [Gallicola sp.]
MGLNVRTGPGVENRSIGAVEEGAVVSGPVVNEWVQISYKGQTGYVSKYFLTGGSSNGRADYSNSKKSYKKNSNNNYRKNNSYKKETAKKSQSSSKSGRTITMEATAYNEPGGLTASGTRARVGAVAVDPNFIPLGTRLYIEGYGYATAEDTGGAVKGNIIDLYMNSNSEAYNWGRRPVQVTILD